MNHYHVWSLLIRVPQQRFSYDGPVGLKPSGQLPQECPPPGLNAEWSLRAVCKMDWNVACTEGVGGDASHHVFHNVCSTKPSPDCTTIKRGSLCVVMMQTTAFWEMTLWSVYTSVCVCACAVPFQFGTTLWFPTRYSGSSWHTHKPSPLGPSHGISLYYGDWSGSKELFAAYG